MIAATPIGKPMTSSHWGAFEIAGDGIRPWAGDPSPTPIGAAMIDAYRSPVRITRPAVRASWLAERRGRPAEGKRGTEPFVEVGWDEALDLVAGELRRVIDVHGNGSIFAGSYGWAGAGRFHHPQSQLQRMLALIGGYVGHVDTYSLAAGAVILPYVLHSVWLLNNLHHSWDVLADTTKLFVSFGGAPAKNSQIGLGGASSHSLPGGLAAMAASGCRFVNISPVGNDIDPGTGTAVEWIANRPNTDTAIMLGLTTELITTGRHDQAFLDRYCVGFDKWCDYLLGRIDGVVKNVEWAADIAEVPAESLRALAHDMASTRTMLNVSWSLQRADHGEQPFWAGVGLAAVLGQIGLPGGGVGLAYGPDVHVGSGERLIGSPRMTQRRNDVHDFIPVSRIADTLLHPREPYTYKGETRRYPDIKLVYWAGGNPYHHHQDLHRLANAWQRPDTVIVHEQVWNVSAKMADIVLPVSASVERHDIGWAARDPLLIAMSPVHAPPGEARDDYDIFSPLAHRLGCGPTFTEGRTSREWVEVLYGSTRDRFAQEGVAIPPYDEFVAAGGVQLPPNDKPVVMFEGFRADPDAHKLPTPSGRIELFCDTLAAFDLADCPGHPSWHEPHEWLGSAAAAALPLHLISGQPHTKLHSQLDHSIYSLANKIQGREPIRMHPLDGAARGVNDGDVVRVFNDRGHCLAGARFTEAIRPGVVALATGAWWDPEVRGDPTSLDRHGNPNGLTRDAGSSSLSQGCSAQSCLVEIERYDGDLPPVRAFEPPTFVTRPR
jgi:biotin/methionine sulfoxide reductase